MKTKFANLCEYFNEFLVVFIQKNKLTPTKLKIALMLVKFSLKYRSWTPIKETKIGYHDDFY